MKKFPVVPDDLLKALEEAFPDKAPRMELSQFNFGVKTGEQAVLDFLRRHNAKQNILEG